NHAPPGAAVSRSALTDYRHYGLSDQASRHHRTLHSFPTRRSSDLARVSRTRHAARRSSSPIDANQPARPSRATRSRARARAAVRSEEHTSELQSPYDIVCRLLLEKKKLKMFNPTLPFLAPS